MTANKDVREHAEDLKAELWGSYLLFVQTFFPLVTGRKFVISSPAGRESHFITIAKELTKVARMETTSLLINVAPGSGKSVLLSMWVAWTLSRYPNSQYLYISYGHELASKHTEFIRRIVQNSHYKNLFGVEVRSDSKAKDFFQTTAGGAIKAFGSAGSITGQDGGLPNCRHFSGAVICFPYNMYVQTDKGQFMIGEIVEKKLKLKVFSWNMEKKKVELQPITQWYTNGRSNLLEVRTEYDADLVCTPNHKIYTKNGWVEARYLCPLSELFTPYPHGALGDSKHLSCFALRYAKVFNYIQISIRKMNKLIGWDNYSRFYHSLINRLSSPYIATSYFAYRKRINSIFICEYTWGGVAHHNFFNFFRTYYAAGVNLSSGKSPMPYRVLDVFRARGISKIFQAVIKSVAIIVAYVRIKWSRTKESLDNKFSYINIFCGALFGKAYSYMCSMGVKLRFHYNIITQGFNSTKIRNFIKIFEPLNGKPCFVRHVNYFGHIDVTYCLEVGRNHNFFCGDGTYPLLVSNCDDLIKPDESNSDAIRGRVLDNYKETILQRPRSPNVPIISIGQRLHEDDISAFMLSGNDERKWKPVVLKSIDDAGNALYPEVHTKEALLIKQEKSPYVFASQFQQDPLPSGGALFKREYFVLLSEEPKMFTTFITADTAETSKSYNDATVFSFWGLYKIEEMGIETGQIGLHWLDCAELRIEPKDLRDAFMSFYGDCLLHEVKPLVAAIEKKSTGVTLCSILQDMRGLQIKEVKRTKESGSKTARFIEMQPILASKLVSFTENAKHINLCITHMLKITANDSHRWDDICDTAYDAIKLTLIDKDPTLIGIKSDGNKKRILDTLAKDFGSRMRARGDSWRN